MRTFGFLASALALLAAAGVPAAQAPLDGESERPRLVLQAGHSARITDLTFSRDGGALISGSGDRTARLWDLRANALRAVLAHPQGPLEQVAFTPDGTTAVTAAADGTARLWDAGSGRPKFVLKGYRVFEPFVGPLAVSPGGRLVATGDDYAVIVWDVGSGKRLARLPTGVTTVRRLAFSADGKLLAVAAGVTRQFEGRPTPIGEVTLWDVAAAAAASGGEQQARQVIAVPSPASDVAFSPDGRLLAVGGGVMRSGDRPGSSFAQLWDVGTGRMVERLSGHTATVRRVLFSPDGSKLATLDDGGEARLWPVRVLPGLERTVAILLGQHGYQLSLAFSPDSRLALTASGSRKVNLWHVETGAPAGEPLQCDAVVQAVTFSPDGTRIAAGDLSGAIRLWDVATRRVVGEFAPGGRNTAAAAYSEDAKLLVVAGERGEVRLWDASTFRLERTLRVAERDLDSLALTRDGARIAVSANRKVTVLEARTGRVVTTIETDLLSSSSLVFSPDGKRLLHVGGGTVRKKGEQERRVSVQLYDVQTGAHLADVPDPSRTVRNAAFAPNGALLATNGWDGEIRLWSLTDAGAAGVTVRPWEPLPSFRGGESGVPTLGFSPDGGTVWALDFRGGVKTWSLSGGPPRQLPHGNWGPIRDAAFSSDQRVLVTSSEVAGIRLWNAANAAPLDSVTPAQLASLPPRFRQPYTLSGSSVVLRDPRDLTVRATLIAMPSVAPSAPGVAVAPPAIGATITEDWLVATPPGYYDGTPGAERAIRWNLGGALFPGERFRREFHRPDLVRAILHGAVPPAVH